MALDIEILYFLNNLSGKSPVFDNLTIFFASYFQYFLIAFFLLILYFSAHPKKEKIYIFLIAAISAIVARFGVTEIIRFFYHRPRPFLRWELHQLILANGWSFPSGHSAFFFALATAVFLCNKKWGLGFFIAALLINISRVIAGVHYPSDILGGLIVGMATAYFIVYFGIIIKGRNLS